MDAEQQSWWYELKIKLSIGIIFSSLGTNFAGMSACSKLLLQNYMIDSNFVRNSRSDVLLVWVFKFVPDFHLLSGTWLPLTLLIIKWMTNASAIEKPLSDLKLHHEKPYEDFQVFLLQIYWPSNKIWCIHQC